MSTEEDWETIEAVRLMGVKARWYAVKDIDGQLRAKSDGRIGVDSLDLVTTSAVRLGVDAGVKAALRVIIERTEELMTPEERTEADAEAERLAEKLTSND